MKFAIFGVLAAVSMSACVSSPYRVASSFNGQDDASFKSIRLEHMKCVGSTTRLYINGSSDVALLTKHVLSVCEPILNRLNQEVVSRGFSPAFAEGYVEKSRSEAETITTSLILDVKSKDAS
jgi:hypothetical protein